MPYTHFHNWSVHTHHRRPKGGNHWRAVRRRQRPWRIAFLVIVVMVICLVGMQLFAVPGFLFGDRAPVGAGLVEKIVELPAGNPVQLSPEADPAEKSGGGRVDVDSTEDLGDSVLDKIETPTVDLVATQVAEVAAADRAATREVQVVTKEAREAELVATRAVRKIEIQTRRAVKAIVEAEARATNLEEKIHAGINAKRVENGRVPLEWDRGLAELARAHSQDMVKRNYFSHDTPEGLGPTDRLRRAGLTCLSFRIGIGENIAIQPEDKLDQVAAGAVDGWMESLGHRFNLLDPEYRTTGIGAAEGRWLGWPSFYLTQVFC